MLHPRNMSSEAAAFGLAVLAAAGIVAYLANRFFRRRSAVRWRRVGTVEQLFIFPLKSGQPHESDELYFGGLGASDGRYRDRSFIVVDEADGGYINSRNKPRSILVSLAFSDGGEQVTLSSPGYDPVEFDLPNGENNNDKSVRLWDVSVDNLADCGDAAARFVSSVILGKSDGARLLYHAR